MGPRLEGAGMKVEIDVMDYLTEDDIKDAALDVIRRVFREQIKTEASAERVISNVASDFVMRWVAEALCTSESKIRDGIADGVKDAIEGGHIKYYVFRRKDVWDRDEGPGVAILDEAIKNSRQLIESEVERRIKEYDFRELREQIEDTIYDVICRKLREDKEA